MRKLPTLESKRGWATGTLGAFLGMVGLSTTAIGAYAYINASTQFNADDEYCVNSEIAPDSCDQLLGDKQNVSEAEQMFGNGLVLLAIGGMTVSIAYRHDKLWSYSPTSTEPPFEDELNLLLDNKLPPPSGPNN